MIVAYYGTYTIATLWGKAGSDFDLMIDDGLHTFDAARCFFENSIDRLAPHGIYIIEDVVIPDLPKYREYFEFARYQADIVMLQPPHSKAIGNNLVVARHKIDQL